MNGLPDELVDEVPVGPVEFHPVEPGPFRVPCRIRVVRDEPRLHFASIPLVGEVSTNPAHLPPVLFVWRFLILPVGTFGRVSILCFPILTIKFFV